MSTRTDRRATAGDAAPATTPATRTARPGWRDPRLWIGVAIVAVCVVAGARLLAGADDSVQVWAVAADAAAGEEVSPDGLTATRVRFADAADLAAYLPVDEPLPAELRLDRPVRAGELLPRSALGAAESAGVVEVPLTVPAGGVPGSVSAGSVVDVWVARPDAGTPAARRVLDDVRVAAAPAADDAFGAVGDRRLVLAVDDAQAERLGPALAAAAAGTMYIVREG